MSKAPLLALPVYKAIETALNRYLSLDSDTQRYRQPLIGKVIQLDVVGLGLQIIFVFHQQRVELCSEFAADADVVIRGAPVSLAAVASGRTGLMQSGIVIDGDVDTANRFSQLFERMDIDWDEHIATVVGDNPAHLFGRLRSGAADWLLRAQTGMQHNVADYLRDETQNLPHQWELDEFIEDVDNLRDRVDKLLQKVQLDKAQVDKTRAMDDRKP